MQREGSARLIRRPLPHPLRHLEAEFGRSPVLSDIVEILNAMRPTEPALKTYQYNNAFFSLAGHLIAQIS